MGTPEFAVTSLECLLESKHEVQAVVTVPDKPRGRGLKVQPSPVKEAALKSGLPVLQPQGLTEPHFLAELCKMAADLFVVVAFRVLPPEVFEMPAAGTINLHSSLLPKYRGAAPINWAIVNGEKETGVSTIYIQKSVDTGDLIQQRKVGIGDDETAGELHDRLARIGAEILVDTVDAIEQGKAVRHEQRGHATKAPKISRETGRIDWTNSSESIRNLVRGLNPWPGAHSVLRGKSLKIFEAARSESTAVASVKPGEVVECDRKSGRLIVATGDGCLELRRLQPQGKRQMSTKEFLLGHTVEAGDRFANTK